MSKATTATTAMTPKPLVQLDKALGALRSLGLVKAESQPAPVVALIDKVAPLDPDAAAAVARTLSQATLFNEVVREQISGMQMGERYKTVAAAFDSIRDDAKRMVEQITDGKLTTPERLSNVWMKVTRGDIPARFDKIKKTYLDVATDSDDQIRREQRILEAYADFRGALKEAEILGFQILQKAEASLGKAKEALTSAAAAVETGKSAGSEPGREALARLEMERDQRLRVLQEEDKRFQVAKDLAENLSISYHTTEVVMGRLHQITDAKERVYRQAVTFFGTNETVLTALSASFTGMHGLHESTQTLEAMKKGVNESLETLGEEGTKIQEAAIRAGYGPTVRAESVRKLVDAVVDYQERSRAIVEEMRTLSTQNEVELRAAVEDGKRRLVALEQRAAALPPVATADATKPAAGTPAS
ncbi:MAG TPA: cell surface protein [Planctomycetota bacterium]|nr:cell surface protein [Planctomycetota bacterium]